MGNKYIQRMFISLILVFYSSFALALSSADKKVIKVLYIPLADH